MMTKKEQREIERLRALLVEAEASRDKAWEAYKEMLYRVVDAEQKIKRIRQELGDEKDDE